MQICTFICHQLSNPRFPLALTLVCVNFSTRKFVFPNECTARTNTVQGNKMQK